MLLLSTGLGIRWEWGAPLASWAPNLLQLEYWGELE